MTAPRRILIATFDGGGNVPPLLTIARKLVARGHAVRVLADEATGAQARAAGLDFVPPAPPPNVAYVGPQLDDPTWAGPVPPLPAGDAPLVLVAMGSTFQDQRAVTARVIEALRALPVRALATTGGQFTAAELPAAPNVAIVASAPHRAVLPAARLMVCHGGHGSIMKALAAGVPVLALPLGRDQLDNAARLAACGAGLRVAPKAGAAAIGAAATRLLGEPAFAAAAGRMADALAREAEGDPVVARLEALPQRVLRYSVS